MSKLALEQLSKKDLIKLYIEAMKRIIRLEKKLKNIDHSHKLPHFVKPNISSKPKKP